MCRKANFFTTDESDIRISSIAVYLNITAGRYNYSYDQKFYLTYDEYKAFMHNPEFRGQIENSLSLAYNKMINGGSGFIYILNAPSMGLCKIGMTRGVTTDRTYGIGIALPFETKLAHSIECLDPVTTEKRSHELFADKRKRGEWFEGKPEDFVDGIIKIAEEIDKEIIEKKERVVKSLD